MTTRELNIALCQAIVKADPDAVRKLIARGAEIDAVADPRTAPLVLASKIPLWASVSLAASERSLSELGPSEAVWEGGVGQSHNDPRRKRQRHLRIIRLLIKAGADMEKRCYGSTPLRVACIHNDLEAAEILLANGADPNAEIYSPLSKRAKKVGRKLVPSYYGTILHEIVSRGYQGATAALIKAGADPNRRDHEGKTAFDIADEKGGGPITKVLVRSEQRGTRKA